MDYVYLINTDKYVFEKIPYKQEESHKIIYEIYFLKYRVPTQKEIDDDKTPDKVKKFYIKYPLQIVKKSLSDIKDNIPLFNIYHINIYLIRKENVYYRSVYGNYRFPGKGIDNFFNRFLKGYDPTKLPNDPVIKRKIRKVGLMKDFLSQFDIDQLYKSYIDTFTKYSPQFGNLITECSKPSFNNVFTHINPYYTRKELINLALNMNLNLKYNIYDPENLKKICDDVSKNDISSDIIKIHHEHIIKNNKVSIVKYYTIQGSYFMNKYLRYTTNYSEVNEYLENNISLIWSLIKNSPPFDNDYYIYRFVDSDSFLSELNEGDIYIENGFMSTTRDPFYRHDLYKFGFILMKIKIPKNISGVALCLESVSLFPHEQEIILPPRSKFRLINKNKNCSYYHIDSETAQKIKVRYEFEWIENLPIKFTRKGNETIKLIDFMKLEKINTLSFNEKIKIFMQKFINDQSMFNVKIGEKIFSLNCEFYNSNGAYNTFYAIKSETGFSIYTIYEGNVLFMIELGDVNDERLMIVNYYLKYTTIDRSTLIKEYDFILFLSNIAHYFDVPIIILYSDYMACTITNDNDNDNDNGNGKIVKQRGYSTTVYGMENTNTNDKKSESLDEKSNYHSSYHSRDIYNYIKNCWKRFEDFEHNSNEIIPKFSYDDLDILKKTEPLKILDKEDNDELYQIYLRNYKKDKDKNNLKDFYIWIVDKYCYLINILVDKMYRLYGKYNNPFTSNVYILTPDVFLYNRKIINHINEGITLTYSIYKNDSDMSINMYRDQIETIKKNELF